MYKKGRFKWSFFKNRKLSDLKIIRLIYICFFDPIWKIMAVANCADYFIDKEIILIYN